MIRGPSRTIILNLKLMTLLKKLTWMCWAVLVWPELHNHHLNWLHTALYHIFLVAVPFFSVPYVAPLIKIILNETTSQSLYQFRSKSVVKRTPSSFDEDGAIISRILHRMSFYWWVHSFYNIVSLNFTFT